MLAAEGHRVVLVVATAGERGLAELPHGDELAEARTAELYKSAAVLGVARVVLLGYGDSGLGDGPRDGDGSGGRGSGAGGIGEGEGESRSGAEEIGHGNDRPDNAFIDADIEEAAQRLAEVLKDESADLLTIYDPAGGYGHPDHVQVYRVGQRAACLAGTAILLEATVNRDPLLKGLRLAQRFYRFPPEFDVRSFERAYSSGEVITHRVNVRRFAKVKRASMTAHASQATGGDGDRTLGVMLKIPGPLYRLVFGTEWYVRRDLPPGTRLAHPFAGLPEETE